VLKIRDGETIPADCVLLRCKKKAKGMCFVQTAELDGERNLKPVIASKYIDFYFDRIFKNRSDISFEGHFIGPTKNMYFYEGQIELTKERRRKATKSREREYKKKCVEVDIRMFLHRGAVLRNSGSVFALVVQTGKDTKVIQNQGSYKTKFSYVEQMTNYFLGVNFATMLFGAALACGMSYRFNVTHNPEHKYAYDLL
jgi:magnesium-transporting ATPase (P-type)